MFDTDVAALDARGTLARARAGDRMRNLLDADTLATAAHWADLHSVLTGSSSCLDGTEGLVTFGGDGTPAVAEFAPAELGAVLAISYHAACALVGDALDLRHRYPQLWGRVQAGEIKVWAARRIAQATRHLGADAAAQVDRVIAPYADRKNPADLVAFAEAEAIRADPAAAKERAEAAKRSRGVWVNPSTESGTKTLFIRADAADITRFDDTLGQIATDLADLGDTDTRDERRAKAVGILARPQLALDLRSQAAAAATGDPVPSMTASTGSYGTTTVYVHLTDHTLATGEGVARVEGIGPVLSSQIRDWLRHDNVTVKPVIDLNHQTPVEGYEIPDRLREAVHLTMPTDTYPYATNKTRHKDIDHTTRYTDTGPPGQTRIGNLAPMTRRHHRIKTFSRWKVRQPYPGILIWQSPHGHHYLVDNTGTRPITPTA